MPRGFSVSWLFPCTSYFLFIDAVEGLFAAQSGCLPLFLKNTSCRRLNSEQAIGSHKKDCHILRTRVHSVYVLNVTTPCKHTRTRAHTSTTQLPFPISHLRVYRSRCIHLPFICLVFFFHVLICSLVYLGAASHSAGISCSTLQHLCPLASIQHLPCLC